MSLEFVNTLGTFTTCAIIAATAIAAMVQLRHMRAGNQINAMLSIGEELSAKDFTDSWQLVQTRLLPALDDPEFRAFLVEAARGGFQPASDDYVAMRRALLAVGNAYEELGILVKNGIVDRTLFLDRYCWVISNRWNLLQDVVGLNREASGQQGIWENFEYLAVLSEDFAREHGSTYPKGVRRMPVRNPWPLEAVRS